MVWVGGFLFDGQSVSDGLFHGGGGGILVAKVMVMGGWKREIVRKRQTLMEKKGGREIGLILFYWVVILF